MRLGLWAALAVALALTAPALPAQGAAGGEVDAARAHVAAAESALRDARARLDADLAAGRLSAAEEAQHRQFVARLEAMVERHRAWLTSLLEGAPETAFAAPAEAAGEAAASTEAAAIMARPPTDAERVDALDAELSGSLSDFDDMLLREQEAVRERARASSAAAASSRTWSSPDGATGGAGDTTGGEAGERTAAATPAGGEPSGEPVRSPGGFDPGEPASTDRAGAAGRAEGIPPGIPDGRDDDVVARQLREAAEKETDPELRAKLWEEYRKYKSAGG